jgi:hypothetical protein
VIAYLYGLVVDTLSQANSSARRGAPQSGRVLATGECRELQKMKNSGNEAKKYLKTKDITFLKAANYARFARKFAQIRA